MFANSNVYILRDLRKYYIQEKKNCYEERAILEQNLSNLKNMIAKIQKTMDGLKKLNQGNHSGKKNQKVKNIREKR